MEGLEVSVLRLLELRADNPKQRIDSQYFGHAALAATAAIEAKPFVRFGSIAQVFRKGIFDIKADSYTDQGDGIPFVRISDLRDGFINSATTEWISADAHALEKKTAMEFSDIVLTKTAYPAAAFVNVEECNVSQDTIAVKLSKEAQSEFKSGFIVAFLNSRIGLALMQREFQGNVQLHLSLDDGKKLPIPKLSFEFQTQIDGLIRSVDATNDERKNKLAEAETTLLAALGLAGWSPPEPLSYTARAADALTAARLDAQYFMPSKLQMIVALHAMPGQPLGARFKSVREMFDPAKADPDLLVRNFDLPDALDPILADDKELAACGDVGSLKKTMQNGDVAMSRLRVYLKETAVVRTGPSHLAVGSSEFLVLRPADRKTNRIAPETLMIFLRSAPVQTILKWCQDGSQHPRFSERDLLAIPVPDAVADVSSEIEAAVQSAFAARACSRALLSSAKRAVEIAIEDSEAAALAFLAEHSHQR